MTFKKTTTTYTSSSCPQIDTTSHISRKITSFSLKPRKYTEHWHNDSQTVPSRRRFTRCSLHIRPGEHGFGRVGVDRQIGFEIADHSFGICFGTRLLSWRVRWSESQPSFTHPHDDTAFQDHAAPPCWETALKSWNLAFGGATEHIHRQFDNCRLHYGTGFKAKAWGKLISKRAVASKMTNRSSHTALARSPR